MKCNLSSEEMESNEIDYINVYVYKLFRNYNYYF